VIALVDYGAGNLTSVRKALAAIGAETWTPTAPAQLARATGIIVPGVGHFDATRGLTAEWRNAIAAAIAGGTPMLGICVGLQWLFEGSVEAPQVPGLGVFGGTCQRVGVSPLDNHDQTRGQTPLKVPHVGWNSLTMPRPSKLMSGIAPGTQVYFTHSYAAPVIDDTVAICEYGLPFSAAVERGNVAAMQFHPEKSGPAGLQMLRNWLNQVSDAE
jgi:glutamine amidotransferase